MNANAHAQTAQTNLFYNTTCLTESELRKAIEKAKTQYELVKLIYKVHKELTPSDCWAFFQEYSKRYKTPLTSIRRAISVLKIEAYLIKTLRKKPGIYGELECFYKLAKNEN
jgi:hypothetical protein